MKGKVKEAEVNFNRTISELEAVVVRLEREKGDLERERGNLRSSLVEAEGQLSVLAGEKEGQEERYALLVGECQEKEGIVKQLRANVEEL